MSYISIILLSLALSVDACVVSFSYGLKFEFQRVKNATLIALFTAAFQGVMPFIGYYLTSYVKAYIQPYASLIVFLIFMYLGVKFIIEAFEKEKMKNLCIDIKCLFLIGIATSIDAFSAGISLSLFGNRILKPVLLISFITLCNSYLGFYAGGKLKYMPTRILEILAGVLLMLLAIKALL